MRKAPGGHHSCSSSRRAAFDSRGPTQRVAPALVLGFTAALGPRESNAPVDEVDVTEVTSYTCGHPAR